VLTSYYTDDTITLHLGDALEVLRHMPAGSVDCTVTSPPYFGLRDYGMPGQIGAEASPAEYVERLRALFAEVRRVLADDGTLWLNLGDSYAGGGGGAGGKAGAYIDGGTPRRNGAQHYERMGVGPKNLLGMPWRVAFALQDDGWILRNAIIWSKPNAMPESVTDRLSTRYEMLFMFSKSRKYWFDLDPIRDAYSPNTQSFVNMKSKWQANAIGTVGNQPHAGNPGLVNQSMNPAGKNPGDVWEIPTVPFPGSHFAVFPPEIPRRCIVAGCKPGGTVLDPFHGSGTTGMVATRNGRGYVGIELNRDYLDLSLRTRLADGVLDFDGGAA
jgi:DNA modification methylase